MIRPFARILLAGLALSSLGASIDNPRVAKLVARARELAGVRTTYDAGYRRLAYPRGDPPAEVGVCTDLVIRAYRAIGVDLQVLVHEDMKKRFADYRARKSYGQKKPDRNIDHRRVTNLTTYFSRHARSLGTTLDSDWRPGDVVVFDLYDDGGLTHIGIISDRVAATGRPLVFHHFPPYPAENDCLTNWTIAGHFRFLPAAKK